MRLRRTGFFSTSVILKLKQYSILKYRDLRFRAKEFCLLFPIFCLCLVETEIKCVFLSWSFKDARWRYTRTLYATERPCDDYFKLGPFLNVSATNSNAGSNMSSLCWTKRWLEKKEIAVLQTKRKNGHKNGRFKKKQKTKNGQAKKKIKKPAGL